MYLGIDCSTQSFSALVIEPKTGKIIAEQSVNFGAETPKYGCPQGFLPDGKDGETHAPPLMWLDALEICLERLRTQCDLSKIKFIAGDAQQHGTTYLNDKFAAALAALDFGKSLAEQLAPTLARATSPIWMDSSTTQQCRELSDLLGDEHICATTGSVATQRFAAPQVRRFYQTQPQQYAQTASVHLISSFLASVLTGKPAKIDYGDGAGMNLLNLATLQWDEKIAEAAAPGLLAKLPQVGAVKGSSAPLAPYFCAKYGFSRTCRCLIFTGDNPASLVGMGASTPGEVVISLGTSDTFFAAMPKPVTDPNGYGCVFGNPAGGFMSLICFRNGSLAREAVKNKYGLTWQDFDSPALAATKYAAGANVMTPFFAPEITPRHDFSGPIRAGDPDFVAEKNPALQVRALLESQFLNMKLHSQWLQVRAERIRLTGGASRNDGVAQIAADVFQCPVARLEIANSAALGSALIAAHEDGFAYEELFGKYAALASSSAIAPDASLAAKYAAAAGAYNDLLTKALAQGA